MNQIHNNCNNIFSESAELAQKCSPFLTRLLTVHPQILPDLQTRGIEAVYTDFLAYMQELAKQEKWEQKELMRELRLAKGNLALITALADISGVWELEKVTAALSGFAESSLRIAVDFLLGEGARRGEIKLLQSSDHPIIQSSATPLSPFPPHPNPPPKRERELAAGSGFIVLGMGKLGGRELNYSSDIDLILLYEPGRLSYSGRHNEQHFMNKLAHELVFIMQERTGDGYVFRTDLRLRPDPASTPPVVNVDAAYYYYEGVGQNWERAAMIKARPVAGDIAAGEIFLKNMTPFMWRRNLDFAAINDIHSIKRQMDSRQNRKIEVKGHNVKLGIGGIREIEFFTQIHQLIWGGREPVLRLRETCCALLALKNLGLIDDQKEWILVQAYRYLRCLEHRIQMVADAQTHSLPENDAELLNIAIFMGYESIEGLSADLLKYSNAVHEIYANSFRAEAEELGDSGNLVFTGTNSDEETLVTLRDMGYNNAALVSETIMGWHHGVHRCTRTKRARELLTEQTPRILKCLAETASPDEAFLRFDEFLHNMPAAVQIFSLFQMNPKLLEMIADIMGGSPALAEILNHNPELLEAVLYADFYEGLPTPKLLQSQLEEKLYHAQDFEEIMDRLRQFRNEKRFQAGVQLLKNLISTSAANRFLADLADTVVQEALLAVRLEFERTYGKIAGSQFAIIALGKLGSREMTFSSDIDLVFVYDAQDLEAYSDGEKSFTASVYYNRLAQRLLNSLAAMGREGRLYEVDTRLRPSGKQGMLAVSMQAIDSYFSELAWTFEYMAFTKARPVAGDAPLMHGLEVFIHKQLAKARDCVKLRADVADMRGRMTREFPTDNPWDIKNIRGGLTDVDFIAQYLILRHGPELVGVNAGSSSDIFMMLKQAGCIEAALADRLLAANEFLSTIFNMLRLCHGEVLHEESAHAGLKKLLAKSVGAENFEQLKEKLLATEAMVYKEYQGIVG